MTEQEELELLKQNSPFALPDNPSDVGWSSDKIKEKFWAGLIVLYNLFKESRTNQNSNISNVQEIVAQINQAYQDILTNETLKVKYDSLGNEIVTTYAKLVDIANGTVAALKYIKSDGTTTEYIHQIESDLSTLNTNFSLLKEWADNIKSAQSDEAVQRAVMATKDSLGRIIKDTYATVTSITAANTNIANILNGTSTVDKANKDGDGNVIKNTYATKTENALKVAYADIIDDLTHTDSNKPLSAKQGKELKKLIDNINTLLTSDDTSLDQLQEIVAYIKNNKTLIDGITTSKVSITDIVDNLTSNGVTNKPLSANQGYLLKGYIDTIHTTLLPTATETYDLGSGTYKYKDLYLSGNLKDGTNNVTIAALVQALADILALQNNTPSNLALLKTYTQTETDLADAVSKKHSHSNKKLLDSYTQTEDNLADAVSKKHEHSNKSVLDNIDSNDIANWNDHYSKDDTDTKVAGAIAIARGKTMNYVISLTDNASFNSLNDSITLSSATEVTLIDGTSITLADLKNGDTILITDVDVPDRWVAQISQENNTVLYMMSSLETRKVDLTPYSLKTELSTAVNNLLSQIATIESTTTASKAYSVGDLLIYNGTLYKVTSAISSGGTITISTNVAIATIEDIFKTKVDKVTGKVLSDNNYTTDEKTKLGKIEAGAEVNDVVDVKVNGSSVVDGNKVANISVPTSASSSSSSSVNPTTSQFVTSTSTSSITLVFTYSDNKTESIVVVNSVSDNKSNAMTGATVSTTTTTTIS